MLVLFQCYNVVLSEHKLCHHRYTNRLLLALSELFFQLLVIDVRKSPFFGIIIDLSTDGANRENMLVYVTYWNTHSMSPVVSYLCCVRLLGKTSGTIFEAIQKICDVCDFDLQHKMKVFCADGDNSMQGHRQGLTGHLRRFCDSVLTMHCAAHRHVLAVSSVADKFEMLQDLDLLIRDTHTLFKCRPKLVALWQLFAKQHGVTAFSFPVFNKTRWFSRWQCVKRLVDNYPVLVRFLFHMVNGSLDWAVAKPLLSQLTNASTVVMLFAVADVLEPLDRSRKLFETSGMKLSELTAPLRSLHDRLSALADADTLHSFGGKYMSQLREFWDDRSTTEDKIVLCFPEHTWTITLRDGTMSQDVIPQLCSIIHSIQEQLSVRFPASERGVANLLSIFEIDSFRYMSVAESHTFGDTEIVDLLELLNKKQASASSKDFFAKVPLIDKAKVKEV
jgi:hypothetical protein